MAANAACREQDGASDLVDLARYPIHDLESPAGHALVAEGRAQLAQNGLCLFHDFVTPAALEAMTAEGHRLQPRQYHAESWLHGVGGDDTSFPIPSRNACGAASYDLLDADSPSRRFYENDGLTAFLRELLGLPAFHRCADPVSSCMLMYYGDGDELGWHFDPNDGVVTLLVQAASSGGGFEFAPGIGRDPAAFGRVMAGGRDGVVAPQIRPGTLALFRGLNSLHRVTPVAGPRPRIMLTMSYDVEPGKVFSIENRRRYTGRQVEADGTVMH